MIELKNDHLEFSFPEVHPEATLTIDFQRTLRIPDDDGVYPLPPGLGSFPLRHVDDFAEGVPATWLRRGGVMLPIHTAEAMWLNFESAWIDDRATRYPFAIKVAAGKIDAVTGEGWSNELHRRPQDYMVSPRQPWLDGFCVAKGEIRQFTAMRMGEGYTAEEQLTAQAEHGGVQVVVCPMKREVFERRFPKVPREDSVVCLGSLSDLQAAPPAAECMEMDMGLGAGGRMKQEIYDDPYDFEDWDRSTRSRCFVHLAEASAWRGLTGADAPTRPPTAADYTRAGLPWFDWYAGGAAALTAQERLKSLKSVKEIGDERREDPLPENESVTVEGVRVLRAGLRRHEVREGSF